MVIIELGERRDEVPLDTEPRLPRWLSLRWPRLILVLILLLAVVTAGDPLPRYLPELVIPARLGAQLTIEGDRLFLSEPTEDGGQISAIRASDGRRLWQSPPMVGQPTIYGLLSGRLILTASREPGETGETAAVDPKTGALSWRHPATLAGIGTGDVLLLRDGEVRNQQPSMLMAVDPASGSVVWSHRVPAGATLSTSFSYSSGTERISQIMVGLPSGRVELREMTTGALIRAIDLPPRLPEDQQRMPYIVGDLLIAPGDNDQITAYGLDRLEHRWTIQRDRNRVFGPIDCGDSLCFFHPSGGIWAVDASTGKDRWADAKWGMVSSLDGYLLATEADLTRRPPMLAVLASDTGRVLGELGRWNIAGPVADGRPVAAIRSDSDGRAWIAWLDLAKQKARIVLVVRDVSGDCYVHPDGGTGVLICRRSDGAIMVWRLPA
ncbi:hypothetical protein GCM10027290_24890 [Micromonospora sonneratiae]|uniref:PQQ-binding-like beta-propeller repeat protein n=1 Tax=Micromonospora sonneratiae TaxID=1184706 RepID=A0ABW3Y9P2_9ACTN